MYERILNEDNSIVFSEGVNFRYFLIFLGAHVCAHLRDLRDLRDNIFVLKLQFRNLQSHRFNQQNFLDDEIIDNSIAGLNSFREIMETINGRRNEVVN